MRQPFLPALILLALSPFSAFSASAQPVEDVHCKGVKAAITLDRQAVEKGVIKAGGTWQVSGGGAAGVLIEPRIEADRWQSETFTGKSGRWDFDQAFKWAKCGHYALRVYAYPSVKVNGHLYHCLDNDSSVPWRFDVPCGAQVEITRCDWECGEGEDPGQCVGTCVGSVSAGFPPYQPLWGLNDGDYRPGEKSEAGPWSEVVHCKTGDKIAFKVRDRNGVGKTSPPAVLDCGAQPGKP
jgi:hypothetical protein